MPGQGGESQLVTDSYFFDWTHDGRYLIVRTDAGGVRGLYLLPMKDGQQAGKQIFIRRYGEFGFGKTTAGGAFIYPETTTQGGSVDTRRGSGNWIRLGGSVGWEKAELDRKRLHDRASSPDVVARWHSDRVCRR